MAYILHILFEAPSLRLIELLSSAREIFIINQSTLESNNKTFNMFDDQSKNDINAKSSNKSVVEDELYRNRIPYNHHRLEQASSIETSQQHINGRVTNYHHYHHHHHYLTHRSKMIEERNTLNETKVDKNEIGEEFTDNGIITIRF